MRAQHSTIVAMWGESPRSAILKATKLTSKQLSRAVAQIRESGVPLPKPWSRERTQSFNPVDQDASWLHNLSCSWAGGKGISPAHFLEAL